MRRTLLLAVFAALLAGAPSSAPADRGAVRIAVTAGAKPVLSPLPLSGEAGQQIDLEVRFATGAPDGLKATVISVQPGGTIESVAGLTFADDRAIDDLFLMVRASRCCADGTFVGSVEIRPPEAAPILLPFVVQVEASSLHCWLWLPATLFFAGLTFLTSGAVLNFRALPPAATLATRLRPLPDTPHAEEELRKLFADALRPRKRVWNWLRSFPILACLPRRGYHEALRLTLSPGAPQRSSAHLVPAADLMAQLRDPERRPPEGGLYVISTPAGGAEFMAVPNGRGRIGAQVLAPSRRTEPPFAMRRNDTLIATASPGDSPPGWRFLG